MDPTLGDTDFTVLQSVYQDLESLQKLQNILTRSPLRAESTMQFCLIGLQ